MAAEVEAHIAGIAAVRLLGQEKEPEPIINAVAPRAVNSLAAAKGANPGVLLRGTFVHGKVLTLRSVVAEFLMGAMGPARVDEAFIAVFAAIGAEEAEVVQEPFAHAITHGAVGLVGAAFGAGRGWLLRCGLVHKESLLGEPYNTTSSGWRQRHSLDRSRTVLEFSFQGMPQAVTKEPTSEVLAPIPSGELVEFRQVW